MPFMYTNHVHISGTPFKITLDLDHVAAEFAPMITLRVSGEHTFDGVVLFFKPEQADDLRTQLMNATIELDGWLLDA